ncbi:Histone methyltransferase [Golovinomyces cichoracearum]|uniref:Histone methyltransferase n=1 Tax=Golovinomyces cichoracearum TaxID=62708 RepID=A0A420IK05_9PEZI|nr:Histone methyltransferase [Golovinomyces cichoracearum]
MVPSPADSSGRGTKRRRKFSSSETTVRDNSTDGYPTTFSSTPPTSHSEFTPQRLVNQPVVFPVNSPKQTSTKLYKKSGHCDVRILDERAVFTAKKNTINPPVIEDPSRPKKKESRRESSNDLETFFNNSARMETRSSTRLTGKPLESHRTENKSLNSGIQHSRDHIKMNENRWRVLKKRRSMRFSGERSRNTTNKSSISKRTRRQTSRTKTKKLPLSRELRNLADTLEYAKIDTVPVVHEVWSNGKLITENLSQKKDRGRDKLTESKVLDGSVLSYTVDSHGKEKKRWLTKGLYAGQEDTQTSYKSPSNIKRLNKRVSTVPKLIRALPLPMWYGRRIIETGRDFKLPFDVCSPLPPGQPKPDEWRKATKNRFIGVAGVLWKVSKFLESASSKCVCKPTTGCDENCQNKIMFYECDDKNCASGPDRCTNRPFAALQERRKAGGKYRVGVEVFKTADRGYGIRSNRCFEPHQIIVEYNGEIITEEECDRRMNEVYKDNDNIQECRCGSENCRGVLGPRPKDIKTGKEKEVNKYSSKMSKVRGKRKFKETKENDDSGDLPARKKRKLEDVVINGETSLLPKMNIVQRGIRSVKENVPSKSLQPVTCADQKATASTRKLNRAAATPKISSGCCRTLRSTQKTPILTGKNNKDDLTERVRSSSFRRK